MSSIRVGISGVGIIHTDTAMAANAHLLDLYRVFLKGIPTFRTHKQRGDVMLKYLTFYIHLENLGFFSKYFSNGVEINVKRNKPWCLLQNPHTNRYVTERSHIAGRFRRLSVARCRHPEKIRSIRSRILQEIIKYSFLYS